MPRTVVITGFGEFNGVSDNPSMRVAKQICDALACGQQEVEEGCEGSKGAPHEYDVMFMHDTLEVSVECCHGFAEGFEGCGDDVIFIHIGVDSRGTKIKLEEFAYNNMSFRIADQRGYQPEKVLITDTLALDAPLQTALPVQSLHSSLNNEGFDQIVTVSEDPGRFLCNYIYFKSLSYQRARSMPLRSLFVHVPPFEFVAMPVQVQVVKRIAELCAALK